MVFVYYLWMTPLVQLGYERYMIQGMRETKTSMTSMVNTKEERRIRRGL